MEVVRAGSDLAEVAAGVLARALEEALTKRDRVSWAVSGGRTPWATFRLLAKSSLDWARVDLYQVDERIVPPEHRARNLRALRESLLENAPARMFPMPVDEPDLDVAASRYEESLPDAFDLVQLGLGDDGHTASLIPGDPVVEVSDRMVALTEPYGGHRRMTLTFPALARARRVVWIVGGPDKAAVARRLLEGDSTIVAARIAREHAVLVTNAFTSS